MPDYTRKVAFPLISPANTITVNVGAAHAESAEVPADAVRLCATVDCHIVFGAAPVATTASAFLPAKVPEVFQHTPGEKLSVVRSSGDGVLYVTWGA